MTKISSSELNLHHKFNPSTAKLGYDQAKIVLDYIKSISNLFNGGYRLMNLCTGTEVPQDLADGLLQWLQIGEKCYQEFVTERLETKEKCLHDTIPTNCKIVFVKSSLSCAKAKKPLAKKDAAETIRYIDYARERGYIMNEHLKYELRSTSHFLTTEDKDGTHLKKNKKSIFINRAGK